MIVFIVTAQRTSNSVSTCTHLSALTMQHFGKAALRVTKNYTKGYSDTQAKVRDATSNDPWGPSGTQMNEIAQLTYNQLSGCSAVCRCPFDLIYILTLKEETSSRSWKCSINASTTRARTGAMFSRFATLLQEGYTDGIDDMQSLTVLDYCLHQGSENVVIYFRDNVYIIKTLKEFQYLDEDGKDQGANVRQKAKDITNLLLDESRLREERRARASMRDRMIRGAGYGDHDEGEEDENQNRRQQVPPPGRNSMNGKRPPRRDKDEEELRKAIEESKKSFSLEHAEDTDLQRAIRLSEEEEAKRKSAVEDSNASALFDDQSQLCVISPLFSLSY